MKTDQLAPGTVLGRYELLLPIASGGMATVWVARSRGSRGFSKTVAIKTILPNLSDDPQFEQMFLDEAAIASRIQHPNVAQIIDLGEQDEILYLAMEWVDGESLSTLSKFARKNGTDIPLRVGLKVISQACAGIHAAHELRDDDERLLELVHRDISPQNILISSSGTVKIVDFGVAKALGRTGETSAGQLKGKVPFMSPEQAKGGKVDRRTDIFALGIILYRVSTGTHPFLDETDIKTMRNIISRPVMPPRVKAPNIPIELERTILKALQKDPDKRHSTAAELETEIEGIITSTFGSVPTEEVATFVRATLGERDRRRRASVRDAALKMDQSGNVPTIVGAPPSMESISGVMLTQTQTPPSSPSGVDPISVKSTPSSADALKAEGDGPPSSGSLSDEVTRAYDVKAPTPATRESSDALFGTSPTLAALSSAGVASVRAPNKKTKAIVIAAAVACGIGLGVVLVAKLGGSGGADARVASTSTEPDARTTGSAPLVATQSAALADSADPQARIDVHDLPDKVQDPPSTEASADPTGPKSVRHVPGPLPPRAGGTPSSKPTTAPVAPPPPPKPATGSPNVPTVQEPGF